MARRLWKLKQGPPTPSATLAVLASLFALALAVAGCGGGDEESGEKGRAAAPDAGRGRQPQGDGVQLDPANPKVAKTGVVAFKVTNSGKVEHNLEVEGPSGEAKLPENIKPGGSATLEVNVTKPGKYER